jgi:general secretion pathway protein M
MSSAANFNRLRETAGTFWRDRSTRERKQLLLMAGVIVLALLYLVLVAPALSGRTQLRKSLPELRQKSADMQQLVREAAALSANAAPPPTLLSKEGIDTALGARGLKAQSIVVTDDVVRIQLTAASFSALIGWLGDMQKTARLSVIDTSIVAQSTADTVNAAMTLRQQKSDARNE